MVLPTESHLTMEPEPKRRHPVGARRSGSTDLAEAFLT